MDMGARYELGATSQRSGNLERETRKGLMTFEGIGVVKLQLEYFDDFLSVNQVKLLPDCTSLLSGSRDCLSGRL